MVMPGSGQALCSQTRLELGAAGNADVSYSLHDESNTSNLYSQNENLMGLLQTELTEPNQETSGASASPQPAPGWGAFLQAQGTDAGQYTGAECPPAAARQASAPQEWQGGVSDRPRSCQLPGPWGPASHRHWDCPLRQVQTGRDGHSPSFFKFSFSVGAQLIYSALLLSGDSRAIQSYTQQPF